MKISVVIVTYNRWEDLQVTLNAYLKQDYKNFEIIVIDNASTDGTRENLPKLFPDVRYLWLAENFEIRAMNIAMEMAKGEIIWRSDDDSHPLNDDCFSKIIDILQKNEDIHIIASDILVPKAGNNIIDWYPYEIDRENVPETGYKSHYFMGGGVAIRKKVYDKIGGFWGFGHEEADFATRAIIAGFNIRYFPNIISVHNVSPGGRESNWRWITMSRQLIRYQFKYFSFFRASYRASIIFLTRLLMAIYQRKKILVILEGVVAMFLQGLSTINNERQVVKGREKIKEITLGVGVLKTEWKFIKTTLMGKIKKFKKNKQLKGDKI